MTEINDHFTQVKSLSANWQNLLDDLTELLGSEQEFISDGVILRNAVIESALRMDPYLLELLMQSEAIKSHFFVEVAGTLIFDKVKFRDFISHKTFLPDSYTAFKNRIGLADERGNYLSQSRDVVLTWPYKDCVLEGGMTKAGRERKEVFWNTLLSPDDITRLFEPKVLTRWERWGAALEKNGGGAICKPVRNVREDDNLLIKGNNLLVLHSLKPRYAGKVKLIYIDPPYNTGSDEFEYNDGFNHSTWLTFMRNRLEVAKVLLARDGIIVVQISDREQAYLKVLMDEVFDKNYRATIAVKMSHLSGVKMSHKERKILKTMEYLHVFSSSGGPIRIRPQYVPTSWESAFDRYTSFIAKSEKDPENFTKWVAIPLNKALKNANISSSDSEAKRRFLISNADCIFQTVINRSKNYPREPRDTFLRIQGILIRNGREVELASKKIRQINGKPTPVTVVGDIWTDIGINNVFQEGGKDVRLRFGKKPEMLLERIINTFTDEGDLVLDFFAGTGTTAAVAHKLRRRWLAIEQLEDVLDQAVNRLKRVVMGDQTGISKSVFWKGGGSFVYAELADSNSFFANRIKEAKKHSTLLSILSDMQQTGFLRYDVKMGDFDEDEFVNLSLKDAKHALLDCLDVNHLHVNLHSLGDDNFSVSKEDADTTRKFYAL